MTRMIVGSWAIIGAFALLASTPQTEAANINTRGSVCQPLTKDDAVDPPRLATFLRALPIQGRPRTEDPLISLNLKGELP